MTRSIIQGNFFIKYLFSADYKDLVVADFLSENLRC